MLFWCVFQLFYVVSNGVWKWGQGFGEGWSCLISRKVYEVMGFGIVCVVCCLVDFKI